jgi:hypothetical protein
MNEAVLSLLPTLRDLQCFVVTQINEVNAHSFSLGRKIDSTRSLLPLFFALFRRFLHRPLN